MSSSRHAAIQYCRRAVMTSSYFHSRGGVVVSSKKVAPPLLSSSVRSYYSYNNYSCLLQNNSNSVLHRSGSGRGNNYYYNTFQQQKQRQGILLNMALFSSALYGAAANNNNNNSTLCSSNNNKNNNDDDEDFISKIKSKIDSQTVISLSPQTQQLLSSTLSTLGTQTQLAINSGIPTNLSYGFFAGYLSGFTLKKIGRVASLTFGMGFVLMQLLAYHGYIDVNHEKLARQVEEILDRNGDGVVDGEDVQSVVEELKRVVGFGILSKEGVEEGGGEDGKNDQVKAMAGGGGFGLGFLSGLRSG